MKGIALRALATAVAATLAAAASAQDPRYQYRLEVRVKPGMTAQYEEYGKKIVEAAKKVQAQQWLAFQITAGGRGGVYAFVLPFEKWADRDSWISPGQMLVRAFGEAEGMKIASAGQALTEGSESAISELQRDLRPHDFRDRGMCASLSFRKLFICSPSRRCRHFRRFFVAVRWSSHSVLQTISSRCSAPCGIGPAIPTPRSSSPSGLPATGVPSSHGWRTQGFPVLRPSSTPQYESPRTLTLAKAP